MKAIIESLECDTMGDSWRTALDKEFAKPYFQELKYFLIAEHQAYTVYPKHDNVPTVESRRERVRTARQLDYNLLPKSSFCLAIAPRNAQETYLRRDQNRYPMQKHECSNISPCRSKQERTPSCPCKGQYRSSYSNEIYSVQCSAVISI
ncbi:hypothetical protein K503DRAFT_249045 [Rhizopogon vinicolor AM-OR11-026]|uniref:Uncharacterized protein n=1 Tax=Rhizopogon vinicolor AM-OR11-026 TaxID=1314800 RepID=A0A1B7MX61_9AGAM|nr:hypothetical protein K503DRAFT_249045 [Rhizopogon vinicolor AM-OR11-026]